jgi:hypothetical protein
LSCDFIPRLLADLEKNKNKAVRVNTVMYAGVRMHLTEMGKSRWREAIDNGNEFIPFRQFEHLRAYMTPGQLSQLDMIFAPEAPVSCVTGVRS